VSRPGQQHGHEDAGPRALVAVLLAGAGVLGATGCGQAGEFGPDDPRSAVAQLLNASISQANGQRACSLLTEAARTRLAEGPAGSCRQALNASVSTMPGPNASSDDAGRATTDLDFAVISETKDRARVSARRGENRALTFDLVRLSSEQLGADAEASQDTVGGTVDTDWRVDAGERQLVQVDAAPDARPTTTVATPPAG
jgi:hypothetical protein